MKLSQIWELWKIIRQALGLVKQAERIVEDKPVEKPQPPERPKDETDPENRFNLNQ
jgi:hypothetical protein